MDKVKSLIDIASRKYVTGESAEAAVRDVALRCIELLASKAEERDLAICADKQYSVWTAGSSLSRPVLKGKLLNGPSFLAAWGRLLASASGKEHRYTVRAADANNVVYTAISSVSVAFDLWKASSRKTPGTYFEILIGSLLQKLLPGHDRLKHVILPDEIENVSTDILFTKPNISGGLVIAAKITTRERIVQAYAQQRILDSYFGPGLYKSILICVSEMQRDHEAAANEICVPGTIRLFQRHLAPLAAIYYLDPPSRYLRADVTSVVSVKTLGALFTTDLPGLVHTE